MAQTTTIKTQIDPLTRYILIDYKVPPTAGETTIVSCHYQLPEQTDWHAAAVRKNRSETAQRLLKHGDDYKNMIRQEMETGQVKELWAAGLTRRLIWEAFPQIPTDKPYEVKIKINIQDKQKNRLAEGQTSLSVDMTDVIILHDFSEILQQRELAIDSRQGAGWVWLRPENPHQPGQLQANPSPFRLNPLTFRPKIKGKFAIFVSVPYKEYSAIELRLSDEMYNQKFDAVDPRERFWKAASMDLSRNVVIAQSDLAINRGLTGLEYIRFVPLKEQEIKEYKRFEKFPRDKYVGAHTEVYSWAGYESIVENTQFAQPVLAFKDSRIDWVDVQMGRLGQRLCYPSALEEPMIEASNYETGPGTQVIKNFGSSLMITSADAWKGVKTFSKAFNVPVAASFGAGVAAKNSVFRGTWADAHPEYIKDDVWPQYKHKEVRDQLLAMYQELLERGARRLGLDFCRYPWVIDSPELPTIFLQELRQLADQYAGPGQRIPILVRFPVPEVKGENGYFDPTPWVEQKLVDIIVPSGVKGNAFHFDSKPYIELTRGTGVKCLPYIDPTKRGLPWPTQALQRIHQVYEDGADGVFIYQTGPLVVGFMSSNSAIDRRIVANIGSSQAVEEMLEDYEKQIDTFSRGIYIHFPWPYNGFRVRIWVEGFKPDILEVYMDDNLTNRFVGDQDVFYRMGEDGYQNNYEVTGEPVTVKVRAKHENQWFTAERTFKRFYPNWP
jgi:hypothetical protein